MVAQCTFTKDPFRSVAAEKECKEKDNYRNTKTITQIQRHVYIFKLLHNYTKIHKHKDKFIIPEKRKRHYMCVSGNAQCTFPPAPFRWTAAVKECKYKDKCTNTKTITKIQGTFTISKLLWYTLHV